MLKYNTNIILKNGSKKKKKCVTCSSILKMFGALHCRLMCLYIGIESLYVRENQLPK